MASASASAFRRHRVGHADDARDGACLQVEVAGRSLGHFRVGGQFRAVLNHCPHEGTPICRALSPWPRRDWERL
ncbi:MAG: Rieske 2Fe-2S domain-containing protein [Caldilineaceae bacterium]|nr:Rieske 2Fe-2S domain-containing protein [Caldilineaceae bacterium]